MVCPISGRDPACSPILAGMTDGQLSYTSTPGRREGTIVVRLVGPLTLSTLFGFQNEFRAMRSPVLILDLGECPYMDSAGLGLIVNKYVSAESSHGKFLLANVSERIEALMEMTRVTNVLKLYPSVQAAEASL